MSIRKHKSSSNDLSVYHPYMRMGIIKYGREGWMTTKILRKRYKGSDTLISVTIKPSML